MADRDWKDTLKFWERMCIKLERRKTEEQTNKKKNEEAQNEDSEEESGHWTKRWAAIRRVDGHSDQYFIGRTRGKRGDRRGRRRNICEIFCRDTIFAGSEPRCLTGTSGPELR